MRCPAVVDIMKEKYSDSEANSSPYNIRLKRHEWIMLWGNLFMRQVKGNFQKDYPLWAKGTYKQNLVVILFWHLQFGFGSRHRKLLATDNDTFASYIIGTYTTVFKICTQFDKSVILLEEEW